MMPVIFVNPFTKQVDQMPVEMIAAYVYDTTALHLEEAARVASARDDEAATNLLLSITEPYSVSILEGCGFDLLSVEPLSLR